MNQLKLKDLKVHSFITSTTSTSLKGGTTGDQIITTTLAPSSGNTIQTASVSKSQLVQSS